MKTTSTFSLPTASTRWSRGRGPWTDRHCNVVFIIFRWQPTAHLGTPPHSCDMDSLSCQDLGCPAWTACSGQLRSSRCSLSSCHCGASTGPRASTSEGVWFILISFERKLRLSSPKVTHLGGSKKSILHHVLPPPPKQERRRKWKRHFPLMRAAQLAETAHQGTQEGSQGCGSCGEPWFWRQPGFKPLSTT